MYTHTSILFNYTFLKTSFETFYFIKRFKSRKSLFAHIFHLFSKTVEQVIGEVFPYYKSPLYFILHIFMLLISPYHLHFMAYHTELCHVIHLCICVSFVHERKLKRKENWILFYVSVTILRRAQMFGSF